MIANDQRAVALRMAQAIAAGNLAHWNQIRVRCGESFECQLASSTIIAELAEELARLRGVPSVDIWPRLARAEI